MKATEQKWDQDEGDEPNTRSALCQTADFLARPSEKGPSGGSWTRETSQTDSSWLRQGRKHSARPQKALLTDDKAECVYCSVMSGD